MVFIKIPRYLLFLTIREMRFKVSDYCHGAALCFIQKAQLCKCRIDRMCLLKKGSQQDLLIGLTFIKSIAINLINHNGIFYPSEYGIIRGKAKRSSIEEVVTPLNEDFTRLKK